jgi:futalosine hydrolase
MRVLVVAATALEVAPLQPEIAALESGAFNLRWQTEKQGRGTDPHPGRTAHQMLDNGRYTHNIKVLITGVGMVATAFALGSHLAKNEYDLAINLGIAGSFDRGIAIGDIAEITSDTLAELGAEDGDQFLSIDQLGFGESAFQPSARVDTYLAASASIKPARATAITVNMVHGNDASIERVSHRLQPQLESMEGAAFFYACRQAGVPSMQIRAVSNYVEKRNRDAWQIGLAIKNLNNFATQLLNDVLHHAR